MRTISILNFKGGVGKSTLAINLGHALAMSGVSVLVVDCDLQANASTLLPQQRTPTLTDVLMGRASLVDAIHPARENLRVVPADGNLDEAAKRVAAGGLRGYYMLRQAMAEVRGVDLVLFDHSPSYSAVTETVLFASEEMLIPCELASFSIEGLLQMFDKLDGALVGHTLRMAGIVPFKLDRRIKMHLSYLDELTQEFGEKMLPAVRTDSAVARAQSLHQTIFEYDPASKAAADVRAVAAAVVADRVEVTA